MVRRSVALGFLLLLITSVSISGQQIGKLAIEPTEPSAPRRLTVASNRDGRFQLYSVDLHGNNAKLLVPASKGVLEPSWTNDGRFLTFVSFRFGREQVYRFDPATETVSRVTKTSDHERSPAWSPDGRLIAFTSHQTGNQEIFVSDGMTEKNLTNNPGYDADPVWSPDGRRIAFASMRDGNPFRLFVMNADGSAPQPLLNDHLFGWLFPDWSPDGKRIVVGKQIDSNVQLHILDLASGDFPSITSAPGVNSFPRWSPDGRYIAFVHLAKFPRAYRAGTDLEQLNDAGGDLMIYEVESRKERRILKGELPPWGPRPAWEPIGRKQ